jgi:hypothetical protein
MKEYEAKASGEKFMRIFIYLETEGKIFTLSLYGNRGTYYLLNDVLGIKEQGQTISISCWINKDGYPTLGARKGDVFIQGAMEFDVMNQLVEFEESKKTGKKTYYFDKLEQKLIMLVEEQNKIIPVPAFDDEFSSFAKTATDEPTPEVKVDEREKQEENSLPF